MPFYDYRCTKCGTDQELFHSFKVSKPDCQEPECDGELTRLYKTAPPNLGGSIRVQNGIDSMRANIK